MPCLPPSSFRRCSSAAGDSALAVDRDRVAALELDLDIFRLVGRRSGATVRLKTNSSGSFQGSSSTLPSAEMCSRLASTENGASPRLSRAIGIWCCSA